MGNAQKKIFTKEKILFLHGYLADSRSFYYQYAPLSMDFDLFSPDLKGFGKNAEMEYPYALSDYCNSVKKYMEINGVVKPHVIAHSFGARIAIKLASENPEIFSKLVLTGAAGLKPRFSLKKTAKKTVYKILKKFIPKEKLSSFFSPDYRNLSPVMKESFIKIVNEHLDKNLKSIENPTLIIVGDKDKDTPLYMAEKMHKEISGSTLKVIKNAGHFAFIDKPYEFNTEVRRFFLG